MRASIGSMIWTHRFVLAVVLALLGGVALNAQTAASSPEKTVVLHAAHLLDVEHGKLISPGEVLVRGNKIVEVGASVSHPAGDRKSVV